MSFDDLHGAFGASNTEILDIELVGESKEIHVDDSELLARLESADTMVNEVEARLDEILGTLDDLLTHLEPKDGDSAQQAKITTSESQYEDLPSEQP